MVVGFNSHITTIGNFRHGVRFYQSDSDACSDEVVRDSRFMTDNEEAKSSSIIDTGIGSLDGHRIFYSWFC